MKNLLKGMSEILATIGVFVLISSISAFDADEINFKVFLCLLVISTLLIANTGMFVLNLAINVWLRLNTSKVMIPACETYICMSGIDIDNDVYCVRNNIRLEDMFSSTLTYERIVSIKKQMYLTNRYRRDIRDMCSSKMAAMSSSNKLVNKVTRLSEYK